MEYGGIIAPHSIAGLSQGSPIRRIFTIGIELKAKFGEDNVSDLSLGNPSLDPPKEFLDALKKVSESKKPMIHGYCANQGLKECRDAIAKLANSLQRIESVTGDDVVVTVGAAGAMNVVLKTILSPEDEVIVFAPFFPEYKFYIANTGGKIIIAPTTKDFLPNLEELAKLITPKTRAVIINSPNNPTGKVYPQETVNKLGEMLTEFSTKNGRPIFVLSDEPYARLIYSADVKHHSIFKAYQYGIVCSSFSKDLSIPGERLGYIIVRNDLPHKATFIAACSLWNRTLGFVNAPVSIQLAVAESCLSLANISWYDARRQALVKGFKEAGIEYVEPEGAFYFFLKAPQGVNDAEFCALLQEKNVLVVPGSAFGAENYVRICYCVEMKVIDRAVPLIAQVVKEIKNKK